MKWSARTSPRSLCVSTAALALAVTALVLAGLLAAAAGCSKAAPTAPSGSTLVLSVSPAAIVSATGSATASGILRLPDGLAQPGAQVQFTTTLGSLNPGIATTNNNGIATATLTGDGRIGTAKVMAYSGAVMSSEVDVTIGSPSASMTLQAIPATIPSSGGNIKLVAIVRDATGAPVAGAGVNFTTNVGRLASGGGIVLTNSTGQATDTLTVKESDLGNATSITVGADSGGASGLTTASATITVITNAATSVIVQAQPSVVTGSGTVTVTAIPVDVNGNPVSGLPVTFTSTLGSFSQGIVTSGPSGATTMLTIPAQTTTTTVTITATVPGAGNAPISGTATVTAQPTGG